MRGGGGGFGERKAQGGEHEGTAKHVPKKPPVTQAKHVKPHDNISLFKVVYLSSNLRSTVLTIFASGNYYLPYYRKLTLHEINANR